MNDAIKPTATDFANRDFAQIQTTINSFENQKMTSDQAEKAFQDQWSEAQKDGVDNLVLQKIQAAAGSKDAPAGFPNLTLELTHSTDSNNSNSSDNLAIFRYKDDHSGDNREVDVNLTQGKFQAYSDNEASSNAMTNKQLGEKFLDPITATAQDYFKGSVDAKTTDTNLQAEVKNAEALGFNFNDAQFAAVAGADSGGLNYMALPDGKVGISDSAGGALQKRIEFDAKTGVATAEDLHLTAKEVGADAAKYGLVSAGVGFVVGSAAGAAIVGGVGATLGAGEGYLKAQAINSQLAANPGLIFKQ